MLHLSPVDEINILLYLNVNGTKWKYDANQMCYYMDKNVMKIILLWQNEILNDDFIMMIFNQYFFTYIFLFLYYVYIYEYIFFLHSGPFDVKIFLQ